MIDPQPIRVDIHLFGSTNIDTVAYDEETRDLRVLFVSGLTYIYENVPARAFFGLLAAPSRGSYFHDKIRLSYPYRLVDESGADDGDDLAAPSD